MQIFVVVVVVVSYHRKQVILILTLGIIAVHFHSKAVPVIPIWLDENECILQALELVTCVGQ